MYQRPAAPPDDACRLATAVIEKKLIDRSKPIEFEIEQVQFSRVDRRHRQPTMRPTQGADTPTQNLDTSTHCQAPKEAVTSKDTVTCSSHKTAHAVRLLRAALTRAGTRRGSRFTEPATTITRFNACRCSASASSRGTKPHGSSPMPRDSAGARMVHREAAAPRNQSAPEPEVYR